MAFLVMQNSLLEEQCLLNLLHNWEQQEEISLIIMLVEYLKHDHHIRVDNYYTTWLPRYLEYDFFALFRMTKQTCENLLSRLNCNDKIYTGGGHPVSVEMQLLMTLWWLGKGEVLLSVADKFNVCVSTVYRCTEYMLGKIIELLPVFIVWPDSAEVAHIERDFSNRYGFPG
jgi:hypothetical protein